MIGSRTFQQLLRIESVLIATVLVESVGCRFCIGLSCQGLESGSFVIFWIILLRLSTPED